MVFDALRSKLRSLGESGGDVAREAPERLREGRRRAGRAVARRAPAADLDERAPKPGSKEAIAERLQNAGQMHKPIPDANFEPGADPRYLERFGRGDDHSGEWFGETEAPSDPYASYFASGDDADGMEFGPFVQEMLDERDHEGGHYAYEDEHEEGWLDDGVDASASVTGVQMKW